MATWGRITLTLPLEPDVDIKVTMPRHLTAEQWARALELLESMRPGIVKDPP